ncbi:MAG: RIP metalloprotease RseP [Gammaproteobacteria bacterium]|nr:RIP metalloprotease RseP [Gammaproteobacteria bacterium]
MMDLIQSIMAFILALGILITFHEFGHYWVARKCNVKILRFSVGFGKPVWRFDFNTPWWHLGFTNPPWKVGVTNVFKQREFDPDETEFVLAGLPLGGYVKMLDEREGTVLPDQLDYAFNRKTLGQRLAIVLAGPVFNFIFAIFAYWMIYMIGISGLKPVVNAISPESLAMEAGFQTGDQIVQIDTTPVRTWSSTIEMLVPGIVDARTVQIEVINSNNAVNYIDLDLSRISIDDMASGGLLSKIGIEPRLPAFPAVLGEISPGGAAESAGMRPGDRIITADSNPISTWVEWVEYVRASPEIQINVEIDRQGENILLGLTPQSIEQDNGEIIGRIGAAFDTSYRPAGDYYALDSYSLIPALGKAFDRTFEVSVMTLQILGKMLVGEASVKNLSGPITIAKYAGDTAELGIVAFLGFLAIVSVSLGVLNLLPIPLLDGGHVLFYLIEGIKGSPPSEAFQVMGQQLGLVLLLSLMGLALYNDIIRVIG